MEGRGCETGIEVAQALAAGDLGESYGTLLLGAAQGADEAVATVTGNDTSERGAGEETHDLGEHRVAGMHVRRLAKRSPSADDRNLRWKCSPDPRSVQIATTQIRL